MGLGVTYSFKDLVGTLTNPTFGVTIPFTGGNQGVGSITIRMSQDRTSHEVAADGTVMPTYSAGDNGEVDVEVQQTSPIHHQLLALFNLQITAANDEDVSGWASSQLAFRTILDQSTHILTGVSFKKTPDKPYHTQGQRITWNLMAANIVNL